MIVKFNNNKKYGNFEGDNVGVLGNNAPPMNNFKSGRDFFKAGSKAG